MTRNHCTIAPMAAHEPPPVEPWWVRIRGARAISWQSVVGGNALISIAIVVSGGTLGGYAAGREPVGRALLTVLIVGLVASLWALVGFRVLLRNRRSQLVSLWRYFIFYGVNATLYFLGVQWLDSQSDVPSGIGWPARLISSVAIGWAWAIAVSLLLERSDRFRAERQRLLDEMVASSIDRLRESQEVVRLKEALDAEVDEVLASTRARLNSAFDAGSQLPPVVAEVQMSDAADIVRSAAQDVVRPLSHQLQVLANASFPAPRFSGVLREWWTHPRMPPFVTAALVSSQTTAESVRNFGGVIGPLASVLYFGLLYLFLIGVERLGARWSRWGREFYVVGVIGSLGMNLWFAEGLSPSATQTGDVIANVVVSAVYIVITSLFSATRQARVGLIDSLKREVGTEELRSRALTIEMARAVDELARDLHGRVQTQLIVCSAELERAAAVGDHVSVRRALSEAASALETASRPREPNLYLVIDAWASVMSVRLDVSGVPSEELSRADVVAVSEEGLANAHRHGLAANVSVTLMCMPDALRVVVVDDGLGQADGVPGLGTSLIRRLSHDRMTLDQGASGTTLTVDLPPCGGGGK